MNPILHTNLLVFLESQAYLIIYVSTFERRTFAKWYLSWPITTALMCLSNSYIALTFENSIIKSVLILAVNLAISVIFFRATTFIRFYMVTFVYVLIITADILVVVGYSSITSNIQAEASYSWVEPFLSFLPKIFVISVLLIFRKRFFTVKVSELHNSIPIIFSAGLMLVNVVIAFQLANDSHHGITAIMASVGLVIMDMLLYHFLQQMYLQAREEYRNTLLQKQIDYQKSHIDEISALYDKQKQFMHDYRNQVATVKQLLNDKQCEKAARYVSNLSSDLIVQHYEFHTGHDLIDAILNIKSGEAKANGIEFSVNTNNLRDVGIQDIDLVCILSNLLDNAIVASAKCPQANKNIVVKLESKNRSTTIAVTNGIVEPPSISDKIPVSARKDGRNHGIGYLNIRNTLEKYKADYEIFTTETTFQFVTIIKAPQRV